MVNTLDVEHWGRFSVVLVFALLLDMVAVKSLHSRENTSTSVNLLAAAINTLLLPEPIKTNASGRPTST